MSRSFARMARVPFTTRRPPTLAGGKRGEGLPYLTDLTLRCTPLDPADPGGKGERTSRVILESKAQLLECYVDGELDIREGDVLVARGYLYQVRAVGEWDWRDSGFRALILEDLRLPAVTALPTLDFSQPFNSQYLGAI